MKIWGALTSATLLQRSSYRLPPAVRRSFYLSILFCLTIISGSS